MSSDSEEDYMSMDFTAAAVNDVRPGLIQTSKQKREVELLKRKEEFDAKFKTNKKKNLNILEEEHREEGLRKPIEEDNKGFALLAKMGYKPGGGIGKTVEKQNKPTALIDINIKTSRKGLGLPERKPRHSQPPNSRKPHESALLSSSGLNAFRNSLGAKQRDRRLHVDLSRSQNSCCSLDKQAGKTKPWKSWFWPKSQITEILETDSEEETYRNDTNERLEGINDEIDAASDTFDNKRKDLSESIEFARELSDNCENNEGWSQKLTDKNLENSEQCTGTEIKPNTGSSDTHHRESLEGDKNDGGSKMQSSQTMKLEEINEEEDVFEEEDYEEELSVEDKLDSLTLYLRTAYFYCTWCGHEFEDSADLAEHCPGPSFEDH